MELHEIFTYLRDLLNLKLFSLQDNPVTILSLFIFFFSLTLVFLAGSFVRRFLQGTFLDKFEIEPGLKYALSRVAQYIIILIGVLISFQFVAIDLTSLAVIFGLLSVGIGFGLQNITANFISGLIIMFERPITVGDRVDVNGIEGDVMEISIRSTKILTMNNTSIIVPNTQFVENNVINFSLGDPTFRLHIHVGVSYSSNLDDVLRALNEIAEENLNVLKKPKHQVHLTQFGDSSWDMELRVWIPEVKNRFIVQNEINQAIVRKFEAMKIEIPFPQRDLHLRSGFPNNVKEKDE